MDNEHKKAPRLIEGILATEHRDLAGRVVRIAGANVEHLMARGFVTVYGRTSPKWQVGVPLSITPTEIDGIPALFCQAEIFPTGEGPDIVWDLITHADGPQLTWDAAGMILAGDEETGEVIEWALMEIQLRTLTNDPYIGLHPVITADGQSA